MKISQDPKINLKCRLILLAFHKIIFALDVSFAAHFIREQQFYLIFHKTNNTGMMLG